MSTCCSCVGDANAGRLAQRDVAGTVRVKFERTLADSRVLGAIHVVKEREATDGACCPEPLVVVFKRLLANSRVMTPRRLYCSEAPNSRWPYLSPPPKHSRRRVARLTAEEVCADVIIQEKNCSGVDSVRGDRCGGQGQRAVEREALG